MKFYKLNAAISGSGVNPNMKIGDVVSEESFVNGSAGMLVQSNFIKEVNEDGSDIVSVEKSAVKVEIKLIDDLTVIELKSILSENNIEFEKTSKKGELYDLYYKKFTA